MAVTGTIQFGGTVVGEPEGSSTLLLAWVITNGSTASVVDLASGANTITVPSSPQATLVIIIPPVTNTATITAKGVSGDTGFQLNKTQPSVLCWQTGASFVLTTSAAIAGAKILFI